MIPEPAEVSFRTRHGDLVRGDLYLPDAGGPHPLLLAASPYQKELRWLPVHPAYPFRETGPVELYLRHGYAYLWLDVPGSGRSEGTWDPVSRQEGEAIADGIEWAAGQQWCTGAVGMLGQSYFCWSQWNAARVAPAHLRTIVAFDGATDLYRDWMYKGGIPDLGFGTSWAASLLLQHQATGHPVSEGGRDRFIPDMYAHPFDDEWHRRRAPFWELADVTIPVLSVGSWAKGPLHLRGNVEGFRRVAGPKRLLITAAATPRETQELYASESFHEAEIMPWYDQFLKDTPRGALDGAPVRVWVQRGGRYRTAESWPPPATAACPFYLSAERSGTTTSLNDGSLTSQPPGPAGGQTSWSYPDPRWQVGTSTVDERGVPDHVAGLVTFTSAPFGEDREFTGDGVLDLHASTDQDDLDVVVRLSVLPGEGAGAARAQRVCQGWLRASHREEDPGLTTDMRPFHAHREPAQVRPGAVYRLRVALLPMSFAVRAGERIRLEISNGDSPMTEGRLFQWYGLKVGTDTYHHSATYPSRLVLPGQPQPEAHA